MRLTNVRTLTLALAVAALAACGSDTATGLSSAVQTAPAASLALGTYSTTSILRTKPLPSDVTVSKVIGRDGGSFTVPGSGLTVTVAKGAVTVPTTFSATAYAGTTIGYDFAPHQRFNAPITLTQDFNNTNAMQVIYAGGLPQAAYFADKSQVDWSTGDAEVSEMVPSIVDIRGSKVSANVYHFSGYLMSSGRK